MPFYFRKSVSAGPFRFNFSKGGVGMSAGVKGLRIGTGPRGHYIHAGRGGVYYRASLDPKTKPSSAAQRVPNAPSWNDRPAPAYAEPNVHMVPVSSGDVLGMQDERFSELLAELNAKQSMISWAFATGAVGLLLGALGLPLMGGVSLFLFGAIGIAAGLWLDTFTRSSVLFYDLEDDAQQAYVELTEAFDHLVSCSAKWHVDAGGAIRDIHAWKRNAGASHVLDRRPTQLDYSLPRVLKTNVTPPSLKVGKETVYLLPDVALIIESNKVGAVAYDKLRIACQESRFIENGSVPRDAVVVSHTWAHPNKNGGPDKRFANNRQLPVCLYDNLHLTSPNGLNELVQVSRSGVALPFAKAVEKLGRITGLRSDQEALPQL